MHKNAFPKNRCNNVSASHASWCDTLPFFLFCNRNVLQNEFESFQKYEIPDLQFWISIACASVCVLDLGIWYECIFTANKHISAQWHVILNWNVKLDMIQMKNGIVHIRYCMISFISTEIIFIEHSVACRSDYRRYCLSVCLANMSGEKTAETDTFILQLFFTQPRNFCRCFLYSRK